MPALALVLLLARPDSGPYDPAQADWKRYDLRGMAVNLPAEPKWVGSPEVWRWSFERGRDVAEIRLQGENPDLPAHRSLAGLLDSFRRSCDGRLTAQADVVMDGWPGLEATVSSPKMGEIRFVSYLTNRGLATVIAGGSGQTSDAFGKAVVESLQFTVWFGQGPRDHAGPDWKRAALEATGLSAEFPVPPVLQKEPAPKTAPTPKAVKGGKAPKGAKATKPAPAAKPVAATERPRVWSAEYGNRRYVVIVQPLDKAKPVEPTAEGRAKRIQDLNDGTLVQSKLKFVGRKDGTLIGEASERIEGLDEANGATTLQEATVQGDRIVIATAIVPTVLKDSPEVRRFFGSLRLDPK